MMNIAKTAKYGWVYPKSKFFDDMNLLTKDKDNKYVLSRIKVWVGEKNNYIVIQGIQSFFKDIATAEEITEGEYRDNQTPFTSVHEFKLEADEYINDFIIRFETEVTEIGFVTNKGRTEKWGGQTGELKITRWKDGKGYFWLSFRCSYKFGCFVYRCIIKRLFKLFLLCKD